MNHRLRKVWRELISLRTIFLLTLCVISGCSGDPAGQTTSNDTAPTAPAPAAQVATESADSADIAQAFKSHERDVPVEGEGAVTRMLADDNEGGRHQRFILRLSSGQTLLVAHNIDLAERVAPLEVGDRVSFKGVYEWNEQGGVVHWTHRDPHGTHPVGWLKHDGETFQ